MIAGKWVGGSETFANEPTTGTPDTFSVGTVENVKAACSAAEGAFPSYAATSRAERADFLRRIADEIDARGGDITAIGTRETGLPAARLEGERGRTCGQLRLFADHIEDGAYLDKRHDTALPDRAPLPRPDLKMMQRPVGPVAVFGASNFPLAFSTAGGDTASALAAGCPVVVKGHSAHPGVSDLVAQAIEAARIACDLHEGVFNQVQGGNRHVGTALVQHPLIKAVGFTGSLGGGRALFDLCASRTEPIPFFGELGSVNPMFLFSAALKSRGAEIGSAWAGSLTMGCGQFCTNPGIAVVLDGDGIDAFTGAAHAGLSDTAPQDMLTGSMAETYRKGASELAGRPKVETLLSAPSDGRRGAPVLLKVSASDWLRDETLGHEVFGPLGLIVVAKDGDEMMRVAQALDGQLTCTLHLDDADATKAALMVPILERKAGRLLANGFPTGVEVADAMVHGGPYPASTNFGATSVGTLSIRRWLRPVCYQNMPDALLPKDLQT
nr:aldehyde dehydrogenase (NADP(+)) [Nereida sp. MMG025]